MARDMYETTVALPDATGTLKALSGIKVSVVPRGAQDVPNSLVDIFASDTGTTRGADPKSGATGINPLTTNASGAIRFWAEGPYEYDLVFEDTQAPARIADRVGWNCVPAKLGSIPTSYLAEDAGITQKMLSSKVVDQQVPIGCVIEWWRPPASGGNAPASPPSGFDIADGRTVNQHDFAGTSGSIILPNLINTFILGADITKADGTVGVAFTDAAINATTGGPGIRGTGGSNNHLLTTPQLPVINPVVNDPGHGHPLTDNGHSHGLWGEFTIQQNQIGFANGGGAAQFAFGHNVTQPQATGITLGNSVTGITVSAFGGGQAHENRPRHYGLLRMIKTRRS